MEVIHLDEKYETSYVDEEEDGFREETYYTGDREKGEGYIG